MKAIITGATKGIGKAIGVALMKEGYDLAINSRSESDLIHTAKEFSVLRGGGNVIYHQTDMSDKAAVQSFGAFVLDQWGGADVLINNAGIFIPGKIINEPEGGLEKMIETNLYSAYYLTRMIVPSMIENRSGHIFNMCSIASLIAYPNGGSYGISKFAMYGMSKALREELKETGVKVTSIMPGATWSNSWAGVDLPENRLMKASDIAEVVVSALKMSPSAVVEDIVIRPQLGDL
jgi:short-subunit dehydrogenase